MEDYRYRVGNFECGFYGEEEPLPSHAVLAEGWRDSRKELPADGEQVGAMNELNKMFMIVNNLNVKLQKDGNQWCYIYGELPEPNCIAGFGDTPEDALRDFYKQWKS